MFTFAKSTFINLKDLTKNNCASCCKKNTVTPSPQKKKLDFEKNMIM